MFDVKQLKDALMSCRSYKVVLWAIIKADYRSTFVEHYSTKNWWPAINVLLFSAFSFCVKLTSIALAPILRSTKTTIFGMENDHTGIVKHNNDDDTHLFPEVDATEYIYVDGLGSVKGRNYDRVGNSQVALVEVEGRDGWGKGDIEKKRKTHCWILFGIDVHSVFNNSVKYSSGATKILYFESFLLHQKCVLHLFVQIYYNRWCRDK